MADMRASVILRLIDRLTGPAKRAAAAVGGIERAVVSLRAKALAAAAAMTKFGTSLASGSLIAAVSLSASIGGLNAQILKFDEQMNRAAAVTEATPQQFARMKLAAEEMGRTTRFTATQAADALAFLGMAGLGAEKSVSVLPHTLALAAATGADLGKAADISTNVLTAFGLQVHQLSAVNDILAKTTSTSNVNILQLSEAMKKVAPISKLVGVSIAETSALIGLLGNQGIQGGISGRGLARAMFGMVKSTKKSALAWKTLGIDVEKFVTKTGKIKDLAGLLGALQKAHPSVNHLLDIFDSFGARTIGALLNVRDIERVVRDYTRTVQDAGFASKAAERRMAGLPGAWLKFKSAMEGVILAWANSGLRDDLIGTFDAIRGFINNLYVKEVEAGTGRVITRLKESAAWWLKWGGRVLLAGAALAAFGVIVGLVSFGLGSLIAAVTGMASVFGLLGGAILAAIGPAAAGALGSFLGLALPIVAVAAAIAGAAYLIYQYWGPIGDFFATIANGILNSMVAVFDWITTKLSGIGSAIAAAFSGGWEAAKAALQAGWQSLIGVFEWAYNKIMGIINAIGSAISSIGSTISGIGGKTAAPSGGRNRPPGRALGGPVASGMPYIVGERGPELFVPQLSGRILPNSAFRRAAAGLAFGAAAPLLAAAAPPPQGHTGQTPQIIANITINVSGAADGESIARKVTAALNDVARSALHDGAYD